jgi:hypothetical protein
MTSGEATIASGKKEARTRALPFGAALFPEKWFALEVVVILLLSHIFIVLSAIFTLFRLLYQKKNILVLKCVFVRQRSPVFLSYEWQRYAVIREYLSKCII